MIRDKDGKVRIKDTLKLHDDQIQGIFTLLSLIVTTDDQLIEEIQSQNMTIEEMKEKFKNLDLPKKTIIPTRRKKKK
jgi:hypothetical protein